MIPADDSYIPPEQKARRRIDEMLEAAGWRVQDRKDADLYAGPGVAVREVAAGAGRADYVLFVNQQAVGVIEAKRQGTTLSGVEPQTLRYQGGLPDEIPAFRIDGLLPYGYESTGEETWFTCRMDPEPTARRVFWLMVVFMRMVRSRSFFEQMKGRGVRTIPASDLQVVTPDAAHKDRFVLVDAVGVTETELVETTPLERKRGVPLEKLLHQVALGHVSEDLVSTLASRLARIDGRIGPADRERIEEVAGQSLRSIEHGLVGALDPDRWLAAARAATGTEEPTVAALGEARAALFAEAVRPLAANPALRQELLDVARSFEQVIDEVSIDEVTRVTFAVDARARARAADTVASFRAFLDEHRDEITAPQVLYSRPYTRRLTYHDIKELAGAIGAPPRRWTPERLWDAYETLDASKVRGSAGTLLTNIVSLVRFALGDDDELTPFPEMGPGEGPGPARARHAVRRARGASRLRGPPHGVARRVPDGAAAVGGVDRRGRGVSGG